MPIRVKFDIFNQELLSRIEQSPDPNSTGCISTIGDLSINAAIHLYPNPASYELNIIVNEDGAHNTTLEVYNLLGYLVLAKEFGHGQIIKERLNVSTLEPGFYLFKFTIEKNTKTFKVIIE